MWISSGETLESVTCSWCWWWYIPGGVGLSGCACLCRLLDCWPPRDELKSSGSLLTPVMPGPPLPLPLLPAPPLLPADEVSWRNDCGLNGIEMALWRLCPGLWDCWLYWWRKWCNSPFPVASLFSMRFEPPEAWLASCTSSFWPITPLQHFATKFRINSRSKLPKVVLRRSKEKGRRSIDLFVKRA